MTLLPTFIVHVPEVITAFKVTLLPSEVTVNEIPAVEPAISGVE